MQVNVLIQLYRPSDSDYSEPMHFRYKPRSTFVSRKRARMNSGFSSDDLPTVLTDSLYDDIKPNTISNEFNKSGILNDLDSFMEIVDMSSSGNYRRSFLILKFVHFLFLYLELEEICLDSKELAKMEKLATDSASAPTKYEPTSAIKTEQTSNFTMMVKIQNTLNSILKKSPHVATKYIQALFDTANGKGIK